jgi:glycogen synthase
MRLLTVGNLYPPHHLGGYELLWQAAVRELRARGHEVRVLCADHRQPGVDAPEEDPEVRRELRWYWRDHEFPRMGVRERFAIERHNRTVWRRHVAELRPEAVSWWAMGGMSLSLIERARRTALPATGWVIDDWLVYGTDVDGWLRGWAERPRARRWVDPFVPTRVDLGRAARWTFCGEGIRASALALRPELSDTAVEPLGVWPGFDAREPAPWSWRLAYVGRIDERKGIGVAIEALTHLPEATLTITGGGDPREAERLADRAAAHGVAARVTFAAPVARDALPDVYAAADAIVFPVTWFEPFGLVPLEAMAVGRPVLATGRGGSGDYLRDGENALLHEPGDAASLAASVRRLAEDPALREHLRAGGLATAAELTERRWLDAVVREHEA